MFWISACQGGRAGVEQSFQAKTRAQAPVPFILQLLAKVALEKAKTLGEAEFMSQG